MFLLLIDLIMVGLLLQALEPLITLLRRNEELFGPRVALSGPDASDAWDQTDRPNKIPRILHQTTATDTVPDKWVHSQRSCKEAYSDFEYKVDISPTRECHLATTAWLCRK
jgi:mannosyltransferase OCH1-like enzyme